MVYAMFPKAQSQSASEYDYSTQALWVQKPLQRKINLETFQNQTEENLPVHS